MSGEVTLAAVGDVFVDRDLPASMFQEVAPILARADLRFGNCEGVYSFQISRPPSAAHTITTDPAHAAVLGEVAFDVMACANNHFVDGGHQAMLETLERLRQQGIATCGAGADLDQARRPARLEAAGVGLEVLAYACVHPVGYEARAGVPGIAGLRALPTYHTDPMFWNPGALPDVSTHATAAAFSALQADVAASRQRSDLVVVSFHWGDSSLPVKLQDYEVELAHAAVEAGADLILGHHHHCLRGVEIYRGTPILYGLASFAFDLPGIDHHFPEAARIKMRERYGDYAFGEREGYPTFPFHPEYRQTMVVRATLKAGGTASILLVPCLVQPAGHPAPLAKGSEEAAKWLDYMREITRREGFSTRFTDVSWPFDPALTAIQVEHA